MFNRKSPIDPSELDEAITIALHQLEDVHAYTEQYALIVTQIERLHALKTASKPSRVSPDTLAIVIGNLLGIVVIVGHERANVVTSKALSFVMKAAR